MRGVRCWAGWLPALLIGVMATGSKAVELEHKYEKGETLNYKSLMNGVMKHKISGVELQSQTPILPEEIHIKGELTQEWKVAEVDKEGNYIILSTVVSRMTQDLMGKEETMVEKEKFQLKMSRQGKVLETKRLRKPGEETPGAPGGFLGLGAGGGIDWSTLSQLDPGFPKGDIKVGTTWPINVTIKLRPDAEVTMTGTAKLVGAEKKGEYECAVIEQEVTIPNLFSSALAPLLSEVGKGGESKDIVRVKSKEWFAIREGRKVFEEGEIQIAVTINFPNIGIIGTEGTITAQITGIVKYNEGLVGSK